MERNRVRGTHILEGKREGLVRTQKEIDQAKGAHSLETVEGWGLVRTRKEIDRSRGHLLSRDGKHQEKPPGLTTANNV